MNLLACTVKVMSYTYMSVAEKDMVFSMHIYHCLRHYIVYSHDHQHGFNFLLMHAGELYAYELIIYMHVYS